MCRCIININIVIPLYLLISIVRGIFKLWVLLQIVNINFVIFLLQQVSFITCYKIIFIAYITVDQKNWWRQRNRLEIRQIFVGSLKNQISIFLYVINRCKKNRKKVISHSKMKATSEGVLKIFLLKTVFKQKKVYIAKIGKLLRRFNINCFLYIYLKH